MTITEILKKGAQINNNDLTRAIQLNDKGNLEVIEYVPYIDAPVVLLETNNEARAAAFLLRKSMKEQLFSKTMQIEMPDGSIWTAPVKVIALHRAKMFRDRYCGDMEKELNEDTVPYFMSGDYKIIDWARRMMYWVDFENHVNLVMQRTKAKTDYRNDWKNAGLKII